MTSITLHRWEQYFLASTVLSIARVGGFGVELIAVPRLTAHDQVAVILLTILACAVVL
jgi:ABC-type phosphate/phosphonate transport system permease subunit